MAAMEAKLGRLRDASNRYLLNLPDRYITLSTGMEALLHERGTAKPVAIVPNGIPLPHAACTPRHPARTIGVLGRIEFKQKGQDFMLKTFCDISDTFSGCRLLIAGDGPDSEALDQLIRNCTRSADVERQDWQSDTESFFAAIDLLVLPSRYEGVPLVMLEALARGIPVIGSNRDGMKEILPEDWTFEYDNAEDLAATFRHVRQTSKDAIGPIQKRILEDHSLSSFKRNFVHAVLEHPAL